MVKIIECPRDAWQGLHPVIPVEKKAAYINLLLKAGFDTVEVGSFVSPKALPQLADTEELIKLLDTDNSSSSVMLLVADNKGGEKAVRTEKVDCISFPFSISETFLQRNLRLDKAGAVKTLLHLHELCEKNGKELIVYITMAFGNTYGDNWSMEILLEAVNFLYNEGIKKVPLTDITGVSTPDRLAAVFNTVMPDFPDIEFGLHLHTTRETALEKIDAAYKSGCRRFDSVIKGYGGCPFTGNDLLGNLDTFDLIGFFDRKGVKYIKPDTVILNGAADMLPGIFG